MKKKLLGMVFTAVAAFGLMTSVSATTFTYDGWYTDGGYGAKEKVSDKVFNFNNKGLIDGQYQGPVNKQSKQTIADGIDESLYIELDPEKFAEGEEFRLAMALNDKTTQSYISEFQMITTKVEDHLEVTIYGVDGYKAIVSEKGVYTYNFKASKNDEGAFIKFSLLNRDKLIKSTEALNLDIFTAEVNRPVADKLDGIRYIWFNNIEVQDGINVYEELPPLPEEPKVEPTTTAKLTTQAPEKNPNTSDDFAIYMLGLVAGVAGLGLCVKKLVK